MDSMRTLNTSLPSSSPKGRSRDLPEQLLQAFRSAALSVTTLYKTAASEQSRARQTGYQDALDDLLGFLDTEHLGFGDGEGWRVRQWATERLDQGDVGPSLAGPTDSDDEKADMDRARSSSPVATVEASGGDVASDPRAHQNHLPSTGVRFSPPTDSAQSEGKPSSMSSSTFTFRSSVPFPKDQGLDMSGHSQDTSTSAQSVHSDNHMFRPPPSSPTPAMRLEVVPRTSRHRNSAGNSKVNARSLGSLGTLGSGAGYKRKIPLWDFFDIAGNASGRDAGVVGKRGKYSRESSA